MSWALVAVPLPRLLKRPDVVLIAHPAAQRTRHAPDRANFGRQWSIRVD